MEAGHRPRPVGRVEEPGAGSGGTNVRSATMVIVINLLDARRITAKFVCQDAYRPGGGLARLLALEPPLVPHRLPGRGAHEQINDG